ncbi:vWA domain-containing protein [Prosthecobacter sp.]|uniref:vWA domain-containing protein n=1 Tax=Prosthecobacter sp. TaxID=1965333 RepID=UPI002ABCEF2E|nr:vWA domain-containing protein [Prosthecobacter sp.]MDZ4405624.1 vWA domain-containing protein [Prosthecobacter sp.]
MRRVLQFSAMSIALLALGLFAADDGEVLLKGIVKNVRAGNEEALTPLKDLHAHKLAGDAVLSLVGDKKMGTGIKLRLAEIVAAWPAGEARKTLGDWLAKHPSCDNDALMFFAGIGHLEARAFFWNLLTQIKGPLSEVRDPERAALAAKALGAFQDNPEIVVSRIGTMLDPANAHVMRACAAEALGGMHHALAIQSLLPHLNDDAIGGIARCSLYRLTSQDFVDDTDKWKAWLAEQGANVPWKMLTRTDFGNHLKLQKLLKPLDDDPTMNMASFYGVELRAKGALFILDVSGSMTIDDRISKLKAQMSNLLIAMQNKSNKLRYGILTFGENVDSCFPARGISVNDEKNHKQAVRFVERIQADGGTPMCEALNHALTKVLPDGNIDTIYFLSDGAPSDGTPDQVLDLAQRIHQKFQTRIHTIGIGEEPAQSSDKPSLLNQIANACGGTFTIPP